MKSSHTEESPAAPPKRSRREIVFRIVAFCIPFAFFLLLEITLNLFNYGGDLDLFISAGGDFSQYKMVNPLVGRRYFVNQESTPVPPNDLFLKNKPKNGYRVFVLGGSTTAGYPYGNNGMFSRILQARLSDVFPDRRIEVVNTAMTAINTYTLLDFMDEIIANDADAILIYAGHNEFYGALGVASTESMGRFPAFIKLYLRLQRFRTFLLVRDAIRRVKTWLSQDEHPGTSGTLMERIVAEQIIPYKGELYEAGKRQFESNLEAIFTKARSAGIPVLISELVSNIRDMKPFQSVASDSFPSAEEEYQRAKKWDREDKPELARAAYLKAKDLDALRFRASEEFNSVLTKVAAGFDSGIVPMKSYFERHSPGGLIGDNLMLDHLHPNIDGYFFMAEGFFDTMRQQGLISAKWDPGQILPDTHYRQNWGFSALDSVCAALGIQLLKNNWPFQPKSSYMQKELDFSPVNKADSLAVEIVLQGKGNLREGHVELAEYYAERAEFMLAFAEYRALIHTAPYLASNYLRAADMLIKARRLQEALPFLQKSMQLNVTGFAAKWLGIIYLALGEHMEATPLLEKALEFGPQDPQVLYNLCVSYVSNRRYDSAQSTLSKLESISPGFPGSEEVRRYLEQSRLRK